ncbi:MAG: multicopper oxidase domain-containing protein [Myxococcales bacterium]|nr:multicopper oxidase domain-containing protein [Myxococcales bacterium]
MELIDGTGSSRVAVCTAMVLASLVAGCGDDSSETDDVADAGPTADGGRYMDAGSGMDAGIGMDAAVKHLHAQGRARYEAVPNGLNHGACDGGIYKSGELRQPVTIHPSKGTIDTQLVVRQVERCVPVWISNGLDGGVPHWEMQTLELRTYGFPKEPGMTIDSTDADDPHSDKIVWSAPGPTFVMHPATDAGLSDGTHFKMKLYNRMAADAGEDGCQPLSGDAGTPSQVVDGQVIEPPNCFHGPNTTNFHFHGFHISSQEPQDNVLLKIAPESSYQYDVDPLRFTQPAGTHWYHAHKHGSTALQVINGLVGTFEVRGAFDEELEAYFAGTSQGTLVDHLMVVQQLQETIPGLGSSNSNKNALLVNGQGNPTVTMKPGEIQRWRLVGATMQASANVQLGFAEGDKVPEIKQIAMDGVQFSRDNYECQPFLNNPDCTGQGDVSSLEEATTFSLAPGNRVDLLVKAPDAPGETFCFMLGPAKPETIQPGPDGKLRGGPALGIGKEECGLDENDLGALLTLKVDRSPYLDVAFPTESEFPKMARFLADLPEVSDANLRTVYYEMVNQTDLGGVQFWIDQRKYDPDCANQSLIIDETEEWTLLNNSSRVQHPFHIHQNPFQLLSQTTRVESDAGQRLEEQRFAHPVWRDTLALPLALDPPALADGGVPRAQEPNSDTDSWGKATMRYVAKEFSGAFVNHCHILGHEDRGMMQNTQAVCSNCEDGESCFKSTGPVPAGDAGMCDPEGFCASDCVVGSDEQALQACPEPPDQRSDWPSAYGYHAD